VVRAIIEIARALGMTTVAEGIETSTQRERLRDLGCPLAQGFLFARPLEAAAMEELVAGRSGQSGPLHRGNRRGSQSRRRLLDVVVRRPSLAARLALPNKAERPPRLQRRTRGGQP